MNKRAPRAQVLPTALSLLTQLESEQQNFLTEARGERLRC